jgi:hypothetical protein
MPLPPWDDAMSDGCTGAPFLDVCPEAHACCVRHDERYYYGGSKADRRRADQAFYTCLRAIGIPLWRAQASYRFIRWFGGPDGRQPWSWAYGGGVFAYTEAPDA